MATRTPPEPNVPEATKVVDKIVSPQVARRRDDEAHPSVVQLMIEVMRKVTAVGKDQRNREQNFDFRGIDDVINALGPAMREVGILSVPTVVWSQRQATKTTRGKDTRETLVRTRWTFYGPRGDSISAETEGESLDTGDKGTAKAQTVAWRVAMIQVFALPTDERDPDADTYVRGDGRSGRANGEADEAGDDDPAAEDRDRELTTLRRKARELNVPKDAIASVFAEIFGDDLRVAEPEAISRFTGWLIAWGRLPTVAELREQNPAVARMIETRETTERSVAARKGENRERAARGHQDDRNGPDADDATDE